MLKRRSAWFGGSAALLLVLSATGVVGATDLTPPDAQPVAVTTAFVDVDGNGIDDTCQTVAAVADPVAAAAADAAVDTNADGVVSTTEAAHSARIGGANCNHGGYVSWIAHQSDTCTTTSTTPTEPVVTPVVATVADETADENDQGAGDQTKDDETEATEPAEDACGTATESTSLGAKKDKVAAAAARAASKAERTLAREAKKAERAAARLTAKADRAAARLAKATAHATKAHKAHKSH